MNVGEQTVSSVGHPRSEVLELMMPRPWSWRSGLASSSAMGTHPPQNLEDALS